MTGYVCIIGASLQILLHIAIFEMNSYDINILCEVGVGAQRGYLLEYFWNT